VCVCVCVCGCVTQQVRKSEIVRMSNLWEVVNLQAAHWRHGRTYEVLTYEYF